MFKLGNRTKTTLAISLFLMFAMAVSLVALPAANAHTPAWNIPTYSFIVVSPNPIGVGQTVNVNFWINQPPPTASNIYGDRWQDMSVKVTKPGGTTETLGPFTSDASGGTYTTFTPDVVGNYTFQLIFPGQTLAGDDLAPGQTWGIAAIGDYFEPSESNIFTLAVQEDPIPYPKANPLPTEYWTRPIYAENNNWYSIAGNWLGLGASTFSITGMYNESGNYNPYTTAPNTAHILWTKPVAFGGTVGGEFGGSQSGNYYSTSQYEPKFNPIIINGILYYQMYPGSSTNSAGWAAVNLRTGQTIWTKNTTDFLKCGQILDFVTPNQYGSLAYLWSTTYSGSSPAISSVGSPGPYDYKLYDAMTGNYILSIVNGTAMTLTADQGGNLIGYFVNATSNTLNMWNSTHAILYPTGYVPDESDLSWKWRPTLRFISDLAYEYTGTTIPFQNGIMWSVPLPTNYTGNALPTGRLGITGIGGDVVYMTSSSSTGFGFQAGWIIEAGFSATDGSQLWITNRTETINTRILCDSKSMGSGVYVELDSSALTAVGYSLTTGKKLWGPTVLPNVSPFASLGMNYVVANGTIYIWTYGGDVYSYNILTGDLNWQYHTPPAGYESPYGSNSLWTFTVGTVADGKLFVPEGHMYSPPLYHGAQQLALNITDGSVVWSIDAFDVTSGPAISDGVMTTLNAYDNQIYAYGKGPTAATVTAPDTAQPLGTQVLVQGTVTDISAGSQQEAVAANFPNGLPCISDESMSDWMEYVYMQQPKPTNATGVKVTISVLDPNNNCYDVGTTTSDVDGFFKLTFTPEVPGEYTVYATFSGSESYYGSSALTAINVEAAPQPTPEPTPVPQAPVETYFAASTIAIIVAIAIVGILLFRKR